MLKITDKVDCCGCESCVQICPQKVITMSEDTEGFLYPKVDDKGCINCNLCEKVCPIQSHVDFHCEFLNCYVAYAKDDSVRMQSSSGGIFTLLAEFIIENGGVVFGAAFDENFMVSHIAVDNKEDLDKLRGSKYLQSRAKNAFFEAKKYLESGRYVLYSGTACQIAGLKKYLSKDYENLYTLDVLCHGVPSTKLWRKYLNEQKQTYKSDLIKVSFRCKKSGWKTYSVSYTFENRFKYERKANEDPYMKIFLSDVCLRPSCHACKFKELNRASDITIGDCWGIQNYMPDMDDDKGTSVVLIHSKKGMEIFSLINYKMKLRQANTDLVLPPSADSRRSVDRRPNREKFFKRLNKGDSISELERLIQISVFERVKRKITRIINKKL